MRPRDAALRREEERRADLHARGAELERGANVVAGRDAARRDDGHVADARGHELRERDELVSEERSAVPAGLGALRDDRVDVERPRLLGSRRGPEHEDPALSERCRIDRRERVREDRRPLLEDDFVRVVETSTAARRD